MVCKGLSQWQRAQHTQRIGLYSTTWLMFNNLVTNNKKNAICLRRENARLNIHCSTGGSMCRTGHSRGSSWCITIKFCTRIFRGSARGSDLICTRIEDLIRVLQSITSWHSVFTSFHKRDVTWQSCHGATSSVKHVLKVSEKEILSSNTFSPTHVRKEQKWQDDLKIAGMRMYQKRSI